MKYNSLPESEDIELCFCNEAQNGDSEEGHYHCKKCECILTQYEEDICCSCKETKIDPPYPICPPRQFIPGYDD